MCCSMLQCVVILLQWENCVAQLIAVNFTSQCVAVWCNFVHSVAVCCIVLHCVAMCCSRVGKVCPSTHRRWFYVAVCCSVLKCVAVCCDVLQCVVICCSMLRCVVVGYSGKSVSLDSSLLVSHRSVSQCVAVCCIMLQCVAVCCSGLNCVAACCSVLWSAIMGKVCCSAHCF